MALVRLTDTTRSFGDVRAVDAVSFSIDRGEVVGFLGPNGAGKTTAMRLITGFLEPDAGVIEIDGRRLEEIPLEARRRIGYLPETNPLYGDMLASEYLDFVGRLRGLDPSERGRRLDGAVHATGIEEVYHRPIGQLSKGYKQRVGLAAAILPEPDILILDEPTEGLDPNQRIEIRRLITELGQRRTVLLSSHVMQEVQRTCSRLIIIDRGRIVADDTVEALLAGGGRGARVSVELEADPETAVTALRALPGVAEVRALPDGERPRFLLTARAGQDPRAAISGLARERDWTLWELHLEQESLEDLFHQLTAPGAG